MSVKAGKPLVQTDAWAYIAWSGADQPQLAAEGLGCGLLVLRPLSFALPHYADFNKFGYVLGGWGPPGRRQVEGRPPECRQRRRRAHGDVSWWYNDNDGHADDLSILFIGDTARAVILEDISYFFLAGGNTVLSGPDVGLHTRAWPGVTEVQAAAAFGLPIS